MDDFTVHHGAFADANDSLGAALNQVGAILDNLNPVVSRLPHAAPGGALNPWEERQNSWNATYQHARDDLTANHVASVNVADIFHQGDQHTTRIMQG